MKVDGVTPSIPTNGVAFLWRERTFPHSLEAIDQNYSDSGITYMMRFYNWTADPDYSNSTRVISISAQNNTFTANFRKEFNVSFRNNFVGISNGGIINVNYTQYNAPTQNFPVRDGNQIQASALYQVTNGIQYNFANWANEGSTSSNRSFTPSDHATYTANFNGKPNNTGRYLTFGTTVNQPIRLYWTDNPNLNVTHYKIWRRVKHNGVVYPDEIITTVNRGVQTYQDMGYVLTSTYSHDLLWYDARGYYSTESTYADPDFGAVYGREFAKGNPLANNTLPTE